MFANLDHEILSSLVQHLILPIKQRRPHRIHHVAFIKCKCLAPQNTRILQAALVVRHPRTGKLFVNLDHEILQLIREAKCLQRIQVLALDRKCLRGT